MTPAEAKNLRPLVGKLVQIAWRSDDHDWPFFTLLEVDASDDTLRLRGQDYPEELGWYKHDGDEFWADWRDVLRIEAA